MLLELLWQQSFLQCFPSMKVELINDDGPRNTFDWRKSNPETSLARLLLIQNVVGCLHFPALTRVLSSESAAVFTAQARKLRAFPASKAHELVGYKLAMYTALCEAVYHFRFDCSRTVNQVIRVNDTRDSQLAVILKPRMSHDSYTSSQDVRKVVMSLLLSHRPQPRLQHIQNTETPAELMQKWLLFTEN